MELRKEKEMREVRKNHPSQGYRFFTCARVAKTGIHSAKEFMQPLARA
jgi:hypothetical protein